MLRNWLRGLMLVLALGIAEGGLYGITAQADAASAASEFEETSSRDDDVTKIVLIAGVKSHPAALHEYVKTVRLLEVMLENASNIDGVEVVSALNGWPDDESILYDADAIFITSDGQDGPDIGYLTPYLEEDHIEVIRDQMNRGAGLLTFHFSTFAPDRLSEEVLSWAGGYFDWQNEAGEREWYSDLVIDNAAVELPSPSHPISNGVEPYSILDEFYFDIRFPENREGWWPIMSVPSLPNEHPVDGDVVAWAIERENGGRGFSTTTGHYYAVWKHPEYRKLLLNALIWTAGREVPSNGVESRFYSDDEVTALLFDADAKGLLLSGSSDRCSGANEMIVDALQLDGNTHIDVSHDLNALYKYDIRDYDFITLNYCNWDDGLDDWSIDRLNDYLFNGGGLILVNAASGTIYRPTEGEKLPSWPEYREIVRFRPASGGVAGGLAENPGGQLIRIAANDHPLVVGLDPFNSTGPMYQNIEGDSDDVELILETASGLPVAWAYEYRGRGRILQTILGSTLETLGDPSFGRLIRNAAGWAADGRLLYTDL